MKIENRQQFLVVLTIAAAALLVGVNLIYEPLSNLWSARLTQIKELRVKVNDGKVLITHEVSWRGRWDQMRSNTLSNNTSQAEQQVLNAFDNWSRESGSEITSIMPQWQNNSTNYMTLNCQVEASGTLGALSQFLYNVEKGPMALKLNSVDLSAHDDTGQQLTLGLQVSGLVLTSQTKP